MNTSLAKTVCMFVIAISLAFGYTFAQPEQTSTTTTEKKLTKKDKQVIIEIFESLDKSLYQISFGNQEDYGTKDVQYGLRSRLQNGESPTTYTSGIAKSYFPKLNFWYVVAHPTVPAEGLEGLFGKANATRLKAVISKYLGGTSN